MQYLEITILAILQTIKAYLMYPQNLSLIIYIQLILGTFPLRLRAWAMFVN